MDEKEKSYRKLKFGLALKKVMDEPIKKIALKGDGKVASISTRELESLSGIRHATIVQIANGTKNASWSTIDALLDGLNLTLSEFASIYDSIQESDVIAYRKEIERKKSVRAKKKN